MLLDILENIGQPPKRTTWHHRPELKTSLQGKFAEKRNALCLLHPHYLHRTWYILGTPYVLESWLFEFSFFQLVIRTSFSWSHICSQLYFYLSILDKSSNIKREKIAFLSNQMTSFYTFYPEISLLSLHFIAHL